MKIVADSNIPFAKEAFAKLGDVEVLKASEFSPERLRDCDILICRSTRRIDAALLDGTQVKFVGTAVIGTDHVDLEYLERRGIGFANAPGSNANSVSEYITSAIVTLTMEMNKTLQGLSIGVVGVGNVGRCVVAKMQALGLRVIQNDPPLQRTTGDAIFRPLEELVQADIITLHVPLTKSGPDATYHMADAKFFDAMKEGAIFINAARGAVVDSAALHKTVDCGKITAVVLDTWENEPLIDTKLVEKVAIGTPHIAGHSFDGKVNGTKMIYDAVCKFLGVAADWNPASLMPPADEPELEIDATGHSDDDVIRHAVRKLYNVLRDDKALRSIPTDDSRGEYFNKLRREYWQRREWHNTVIKLKGAPEPLADKLRGLGFIVKNI